MAEETKNTQETANTEPAETMAVAAPEAPLPKVTDDNAAQLKTAPELPEGEKREEVKGDTLTGKPADETSEHDRISALEGKLAAREAGVPKENTEDVLTLARAEMKKSGCTLEAAIESVLKRHPSLKGTPPASITTGAATRNDVPEDMDDAAVKAIMGIK